MNKVMVSIICLTYNQDKYIRDTLDGFLSQETEFSYEIIIHDDASTDKTPEIIREYQKKYPTIIKPIFENVNQYSLKTWITYECIKKACGKYYAFCEGDDYWVDRKKLQKQISYMENHTNCTFSFSNGYFWEHGTITGQILKPTNKRYNILMLPDVAKLSYIPTASFVLRSDITIPLFEGEMFRGDDYWKYISTGQGYALYINDCTCVYRRYLPNSISSYWRKIRRMRQIVVKNITIYINT